ncbi:MAG: NF038143 family protein [SAR324 cluster bacterium]|jgi:hypothetical protein|nr:NF038143 family protein [SAR324 cluster bacterium]MDP7139633.1 NF038143 family protein [SAR324 cluster bacterium]MDP7332860.1 NF038143 family protein [SAR324 cluster bacterium]|tara:strand:+ start:961 stop:1542 length:582 start_codon:yes stop_codon:yes gene_type:complete
MNSLDQNKALIIEHEQLFAARLASALIPKPEPELWMILIPIFFVFFFFRLNKVREGRQEFIRHYLITRRATLDEACDAIEEKREVEVDAICELTLPPKETRSVYDEWLQELSKHYCKLASVEGGSFKELVQQVYYSRKHFQLFLNRLQHFEHNFNLRLQNLPDFNTQAFMETARSMEEHSKRMRKDLAENLFS